MPESLARFTVSMPATLVEQLDAPLEARGMPTRSHAVAEMIRRYLLDHTEELGERVMAGVITVVYANDRGDVRGRVRDIQHRFMKEVISSQHVFLERQRSLEALLVQAPGTSLQALADELSAVKGMETVKLAITAALLPPLHEGSEEGPGELPSGTAS
jgi:CopG family nickel-responsive transcriptional regulator